VSSDKYESFTALNSVLLIPDPHDHANSSERGLLNPYFITRLSGYASQANYKVTLIAVKQVRV